ncbi:hypothetical protein GW781_13425 [bacterium]|nr:hypothetical protein [bacterium]NCT22138.1 hypothetical protein [bacterium]
MANFLPNKGILSPAVAQISDLRHKSLVRQDYAENSPFWRDWGAISAEKGLHLTGVQQFKIGLIRAWTISKSSLLASAKMPMLDSA